MPEKWFMYVITILGRDIGKYGIAFESELQGQLECSYFKNQR